MYAQPDALDWEHTPVAATTSEISHGRIETRTIRVLPAPEDLGFPYPSQAILLERYVTIKKKGQWVSRNCEAVLYVTSLDAALASPATCSPMPAATGRSSTCTGSDATWSGARTNPPSAPATRPR